MPGEEVYIARFGAWVARALGAGGSFAADLDTDGLGLRMPEAITTDPAVQASGTAVGAAGALVEQAGVALDAAVNSGDEGALVQALGQLTEGLYQFVDATAEFVAAIDARTASIGDPAERAAVESFVVGMVRRVIDYLVISILEIERPRLTFLLKLIGLIEWEAVPADTVDPASRPYVKKTLRLERVKDIVTDPVAHFASVFRWGTTDFDPDEIFRTAAGFFHENASVEVGRVGTDAFIQRGPFKWSRDSSVTPPGLMLDVTAAMDHTLTGRADFSEKWGAALESTLAFSGGVIGRLHPAPNPVDAPTVRVEPKEATVSGDFELKVDRNPSARPFDIVAGNDLIRLSTENTGIGAGVVIGASTASGVTIDPRVFAEMTGLTVQLGSASSDSFIATLLASAEIEGRFDLALEWRLSEGLIVRAAGGLEIAIPMHQSLGPIELQTLFLVLRITEAGSLKLETSAALNGRLGPLSAAVERIGAELVVAPVGGADARFGPVDVALGFKPPNGVGLAIDAGVVRGGGYLRLDYDRGEYAGALELVFSEFLALKAIGLVTTRNPDGSPGFSLLVIITAEFGTPLQLGFGFTLNGVGGMLGLNRTMRLDELVAGVRTGAIDRVMFPQNVVQNAPQIISDMRRFFPPQPDTFLIGPMAKLGWGTPTLVTVSIGLVVEAPPGNIAILGVLKVALPDEEAALLVLKVSFIGAFEVDRQRIWFFASMFESRVLFMTVNGEMGLLIAWGDQPEFVISVGGFHPAFNPPPIPFPAPRRVSLSILDESYARLRVEGYFAVTSNTAQFGARVELFFGLSAFSIDGHIGFDALFQFSPFYFNISFSASVSVRVFGAGLFSVRVRGELEGTSPWHIEGEGALSVLFWEIEVPFSETWGEPVNTSLPDVAAIPILEGELRERDNWTALPPAGARLGVSLRRIEATEELVLHPVGALRVNQRALPLDLDIEKVGSRAISDVRRARLAVTTPGLRREADVKEPFATAQYRNVDQAARLSAPSYEPQNAGIDVTVQGDDIATSHAVKRIVLQELIIIDSNYKEHVAPFFNSGLTFFTLFLNANAAARSPLSAATKRAKQPFDDHVQATAPGYVVAAAADNAVTADATRFASQASAHDFLASELAANPALRDQLHVIPEAEAIVAV